MDLPTTFTRRIVSTFAPEGEAWLATLPDLIDRCARRWDLTIGPPFDNLSYNYVAPAALAGGAPVVLKLGVPRDELSTEIDALRHYAGSGAVRLLAADEAEGALLLERLLPGDPLALLAATDDEAATAIAADVMAALWRPTPAGHRYPHVAGWFAGLAELRAHFAGGTGPFPAPLVARAEALSAELLATQIDTVVLHGDLHHDNILAAGGVWLAIDPKGLLGEPAFEAAALLRNPIDMVRRHPQLDALLAGRIAVLSGRLGLDPRRIHGWALAFAVLSAWWSYEDEPAEFASDFAVAQALDRIAPSG